MKKSFVDIYTNENQYNLICGHIYIQNQIADCLNDKKKLNLEIQYIIGVQTPRQHKNGRIYRLRNIQV